jgi:hypothetical protein
MPDVVAYDLWISRNYSSYRGVHYTILRTREMAMKEPVAGITRTVQTYIFRARSEIVLQSKKLKSLSSTSVSNATHTHTPLSTSQPLQDSNLIRTAPQQP